jgi:hypothetical protein
LNNKSDDEESRVEKGRVDECEHNKAIAVDMRGRRLHRPI